MFSAKDAAAEFRIKVSSQMNLEYAVASDGATGCTMSCPLIARCEALSPLKHRVECQRCSYYSKDLAGGFAKRVLHLPGSKEGSVAGSGAPSYQGQSVPACPKFNIQDNKDLLCDLERAVNFVPENVAEKKGA